MRNLLASTALGLLAGLPLAGPVLAQASLAGPDPTTETLGGPASIGRLRATQMLGRTVYMSDGAATVGLAQDGPSPDWQEVGPVVDVLITEQGRVAEIVIDIGGIAAGTAGTRAGTQAGEVQAGDVQAGDAQVDPAQGADAMQGEGATQAEGAAQAGDVQAGDAQADPGQGADAMQGEGATQAEGAARAGGDALVGLSFDDVELVPDAGDARGGFFIVYTGSPGSLDPAAPWDWDAALSGAGGALDGGTPSSGAAEGAQSLAGDGGTAPLSGEGLAGEIAPGEETPGEETGAPTTEVGPEGVPRGGNLTEGSPEVEVTDDRAAAPEPEPRTPGEPLSATAGPLVTDELVGAEVIGAGGEVIGRIDELVMTPGGEVSAVVVGVGGFLGIGEHRVALPFDGLRMRGVGADGTLQADVTRAQIEEMEAYGG